MKKNKMMRIASVLLVAVLLTTCVISGTFAKYVTSASSTDKARVAVWGINADAVTMDLFDSMYDNTVKANDGDNLIAPGTNGTSNFSIVNASDVAPEVSYKVEISLEGSTIADSINNNPNIQWKLDDGTWGDWDALLASVKALSGDASGVKEYGPGEIASEFATGETHTISWQWLFETVEGATADAAQDQTDTDMGNAAVSSDIEVTLVVKITATQID